jgi:hypothetical protein
MTWSAVYVSHSRISTTRNLPHRAKREQIEPIDTCRSDFGKIKQVLPIVRLKNGKSFKLGLMPHIAFDACELHTTSSK